MLHYKSNSILRNKSYISLFNNSITSRLKSHLSIDEVNKNPELSSALNPEKRIVFKILTPNKYKIINHTSSNEKKQRLINGINTFKKLYFNYNKNIRYSLDEMTTLSRSNKHFIKSYNKMIEKTGIPHQTLFPDVKAEYEKQNYILPEIGGNNNLFRGSLLLSNNDEDLKKYIRYNFGDEKTNKKSILFLEKMNEGIDDETKEEKVDLYNPIFGQKNNEGGFNSVLALKAYKYRPKKVKREIIGFKKDIKKIQRTIDSMNDIEYFFNSDNKEYLDTLRYFNSRNTSANFSTGIVEGSTGNNVSSIDKFNKSNILSLKNINEYTLDEKESRKNKTQNPNIKFNLSPNTSNSFGDKNIQTNLMRHLISKPKKKRKIKSKFITKKNYKKILENLYNNVSKTFDSTKYDKKIKSYFKLRKYRIEPNISKENICKNMENLREMICKDNSIKRVIEFRKNVGDTFNNVNNINSNQNLFEKKINDIEDQMIKSFSALKS